MLTNQHYFNQTVRNLAAKERPAADHEGRCLYLIPADESRTGRVERCAVGDWIPDGHPAQRCSASIFTLDEIHEDLSGVAWPVGGIELAARLQSFHDAALLDCEGVIQGRYRDLRMIAMNYRLDASVVGDIEILLSFA